MPRKRTASVHLIRSTLMLEMPTLCRVRLIEDVALSASLRLSLILTLCVHESKASLVHRRLGGGRLLFGGFGSTPGVLEDGLPPLPRGGQLPQLRT